MWIRSFLKILSILRYTHLTGRKIFEFVIKNGETIDQSSYYVDKDEKIWLGDTHVEYYNPSFPSDKYPVTGDGQDLLTQAQLNNLRADQIKNIKPIILKGLNTAKSQDISQDRQDLILTEKKV